MINRFLERMLVADPSYPSKDHQREFLRRYELRQARFPCPTDHEHENECYVLREAGRVMREGTFKGCGV